MASFPLYANFAELSFGETGRTIEDREPCPEDHELGCGFVSPPSADLLCRLCGVVLRDPHQAQCCGNHYCRYCLKLQLNEKSECAFCFSRQVRAFRDVSVTRRVNQLRIKCPHGDRGCPWSGQLADVGNHLEKCVAKPAACRTCAGVFSRDGITDHEKTLCSKRPFQCQYCNQYKSTYEVVKTVHWPKCLQFPIYCPNGCTNHSIPRKDVLRHLRSECPVRRRVTELSAIVEQVQSQLREKDAEIEVLRLKVSMNPPIETHAHLHVCRCLYLWVDCAGFFSLFLVNIYYVTHRKSVYRHTVMHIFTHITHKHTKYTHSM